MLDRGEGRERYQSVDWSRSSSYRRQFLVLITVGFYLTRLLAWQPDIKTPNLFGVFYIILTSGLTGCTSVCLVCIIIIIIYSNYNPGKPAVLVTNITLTSQSVPDCTALYTVLACALVLTVKLNTTFTSSSSGSSSSGQAGNCWEDKVCLDWLGGDLNCAVRWWVVVSSGVPLSRTPSLAPRLW